MEAGGVEMDGFSVMDTFRKHIYGCFIDDLHGIKNLDVIGADNVMIETDYPHSDSTWPNCLEPAQKQLVGPLRYRPAQDPPGEREAIVPLHFRTGSNVRVRLDGQDRGTLRCQKG